MREVRGTGLPVRGDDIDTDRIIPARFLKSITFDGLERHLFEDDREQASAAGRVHPVSDPRYAPASILIVETNFGCGSSREHAPQAIQRRGIQAIVGRSFSEIFFGNALALGLPCVRAEADAIAFLLDAVEREPCAELIVRLDALEVAATGGVFRIALPPPARESLLEGSWDATGQLLDDYAAVRATAGRLPYLNW